jgi:hypothetical protein
MISKNLNGKEYLFVEVPENGHSFKLDDDQDIYYLVGPLRKPRCLVFDGLPEGYWLIVGKASELTEDQWKGIVAKHVNMGFMNYAVRLIIKVTLGWTANWAMLTAKESGLSLIASLQLKPETTLIIQKI